MEDEIKENTKLDIPLIATALVTPAAPAAAPVTLVVVPITLVIAPVVLVVAPAAPVVALVATPVSTGIAIPGLLS
jgi:hypothetical protein